VFCASLAELDAERHTHSANITTFGDSLWWAMSTVTTVGYGDKYPVTAEGRFVAVGLMIGGVALIGVITAALASWLIDRVRQTEVDAQAPSLRDLHALSEKVDQLTALVRGQAATTVTGLPTPGQAEPGRSDDGRTLTPAAWPKEDLQILGNAGPALDDGDDVLDLRLDV